MPNDQYAITASAIRTDSGERYINWRDITATGFALEVSIPDGTLSNTAHSFAIHATNAQPPRGGTGADAWARTIGSGADAAFSGSFNMASVTNDNAGEYVYTFTTPMPSTGYQQ